MAPLFDGKDKDLSPDENSDKWGDKYAYIGVL